jgi:hypothetical protein
MFNIVRRRKSYPESSPVDVVVAATEFGELVDDTEIEVPDDGF